MGFTTGSLCGVMVLVECSLVKCGILGWFFGVFVGVFGGVYGDV